MNENLVITDLRYRSAGKQLPSIALVDLCQHDLPGGRRNRLCGGTGRCGKSCPGQQEHRAQYRASTGGPHARIPAVEMRTLRLREARRQVGSVCGADRYAQNFGSARLVATTAMMQAMPPLHRLMDTEVRDATQPARALPSSGPLI